MGWPCEDQDAFDLDAVDDQVRTLIAEGRRRYLSLLDELAEMEGEVPPSGPVPVGL